MLILVDSSGHLVPKSQVTDYQCRGEELEHYNLLQYFVDTYETDIDNKDEDESEDEDGEINRHPGRPRHERVRYLPVHPKYEQKHRVLCSKGHRNLPNFIGRYFPRRDYPELYNFYCASMLLLLKPWRNLREDIKPDGQSWRDAFSKFLQNAPLRTQFILSGIQCFHDCDSAAKAAKAVDKGDSRHEHEPGMDQYTSDEDDNGMDEIDEISKKMGCLMDAEEVDALVSSQKNIQEEIHGRLAIEIARQARIFPPSENEWHVDAKNHVSTATGGDV